MSKIKTFKELYLHELSDLFSAEHQISKALPKMAEAAESPELKQAFEGHLQETGGHLARLEQIFSMLGEKPDSTKCKAVEGLIKEGEETINSVERGEVRDAALIGAAQRVEHYEMAAYGTTRTFAHILGLHDQEKLLQETLDEEGNTNKKLTTLSEKVNPAALATK